MKIREVVEALEQLAPLPLQEDWDNAGVQVGLTEAEVSGVLLCLDVTESIIDEAIGKGCNLVVSHHPLLFHGLKRIGDGTHVERSVSKAIRAGITVVAMHTNMDNAFGGVNYRIASKLGMADISFIGEKSVGDVKCGSGVIGSLPDKMDSKAFIYKVKETFGVECAMCNRLMDGEINRVAICGGAGDFLLGQAMSMGADAFITGEMHYHNFFGNEGKIQICVIGHYQSEQYTSEIFLEAISRRYPTLPAYIAETNTNPIIYI